MTALDQSEGWISSKMAELKIRHQSPFWEKSQSRPGTNQKAEFGASDPINGAGKQGNNFWGKTPYVTVLANVSLYPPSRELVSAFTLAHVSLYPCSRQRFLSHASALTLVQSLNSPFFPPPIGAELGRAKGESRITCMRMLRTPPFFPPNRGKNHIWKYFPDSACGAIF